MKNTIIVILSVLVIGLGSFLIFDKVLNKEESKTIENSSANVNNQIANESPITENNSLNYKTYSDNVIKQMDNYYSETELGKRDIWKSLNVSNFIKESALTFELKTNGDVYAKIDSRFVKSDNEKQLLAKYGESSKIDSNIIDIYLLPEGNGGFDVNLYLIKSDGSLKKLYYSSVSENAEFKLEDNYKNLNNIIYVDYHFNMGSTVKYATDIYGNFYDLNK